MNLSKLKKILESQRTRIKTKTITPSADQARLQREMDYRKRIGLPNAKLRRLQQRVRTPRRGSYGKE